MKKKFINGILMVALIVAATTSFVSCKDNVNDDFADVYAQLASKSSNLQKQIDDLGVDIKNIKPEIIENIYNQITQVVQYNGDSLKQVIENKYNPEVERLDGRVDSVKGQLTVINDWITAQTIHTDSIDKALRDIDSRINGLSDSVANLYDRLEDVLELFSPDFITGVDINATANDVLGYVNLPGLNIKALGAYYGENAAGIDVFPQAGIDFNVGGSAFACYLEEYEVPTSGLYEFDGDIITEPVGNAGNIVFTINSASYKAFDINKFNVLVENSVAKESPVKLTNIKKSDINIKWGVDLIGNGKASLVHTGTFADNGLYEAQATIAPENFEGNDIDVVDFIEGKAKSIQNSLLEAAEKMREADGEGHYKVVFKQGVREAARVIYDLLDNTISTNNATGDSHRLAFYATSDDINVRKGQSDLNLAVTAIKPLSYNTFWEYEKAKTDNWILEVPLEKAISRVAHEINERWGSEGISAKIVSLNESKQSVIVKVNSTQEEIVISNDQQWDNLKKAINVNGGLDTINAKVKELLKVVTLGKVTDKAENRINKYIDQGSDYLTNLINKHALTRAIAPIILFETNTGIDRLAEGMFIKPGIMQAYLTSATGEIFAPAFKKYVAIEKDGVILNSAILPGGTVAYNFDLTEKGDYKIILSAVDYYGWVITKKYDVYVK